MKKLTNALKRYRSNDPKAWGTAGLVPYVKLMTEYMRLSPSYDLARRYRSEKWTDETLHAHIIELYQLKPTQVSDETMRQFLINDFDRVLKTYDDFGDLSNNQFVRWWQKRGIDLFGYDFDPPRPFKIGQLDREERVRDEISSNLKKYLTEDRVNQGNPPTILIALPLVLPKRRLLKQISLMIDQAKVSIPIKAQKAKRSFSSKRLRYEPLQMYLDVLRGRARDPDMPLWKLGLKCNISPKNEDSIAADAKPNSKNVDQRIVLAVLTSRALKNAIYIAEHAARGDFPLKTKRLVPVYDWEKIYEINARGIRKLNPPELWRRD